MAKILASHVTVAESERAIDEVHGHGMVERQVKKLARTLRDEKPLRELLGERNQT